MWGGDPPHAQRGGPDGSSLTGCLAVRARAVSWVRCNGLVPKAAAAARDHMAQRHGAARNARHLLAYTEASSCALRSTMQVR